MSYIIYTMYKSQYQPDLSNPIIFCIRHSKLFSVYLKKYREQTDIL